MLSKKIELIKKKIAKFRADEQELITRSEELEGAMEEVETDEELEVLEDEVTELEDKKGELKEKIEDLESEIEGLEEELEELNSKEPTRARSKEKEGENRGMELRQAIGNYVRTKQLREDPEVEGFKIVDGGVLVPEQMLAPFRKPEDVVDLSKLINVVKVNRGAGLYPIIAKSDGRMVSVAELEKNPELVKPEITDASYKVETYRGYIPVSQEVIDDADFNVAGLIAEEISNQELNTKNDAIAAVLKTATPKSPEGLDGLKEIFNVDLKRAYARKAVISSSLYNELDITKDKNGRYLLQDDITVASGKRLFGHEVVVLDDDVIGENVGDLVGFIGDPKAFATLFDRKQASAKWIDHQIYGQLLAGYIRFDVKEIDEDAGFYITYTPETDPEEGE